jgi:hypothetical protein
VAPDCGFGCAVINRIGVLSTGDKLSISLLRNNSVSEWMPAQITIAGVSFITVAPAVPATVGEAYVNAVLGPKVPLYVAVMLLFWDAI